MEKFYWPPASDFPDRLQHHDQRCARDTGRLIQRTDVTPGLEALAAQLPPGQEVVLSCYRLYGPEFTARVVKARRDWEAESKARRARRAKRGPAI